MSRIILALALVAAVAAFFWFDLGAYLTIEAIKAQQADAAALYAANPIAVIALFMAVYIAVTAASLVRASRLPSVRPPDSSWNAPTTTVRVGTTRKTRT